MSAQVLSVLSGGPSITVRRAKPEDAPECGRVCFDAFYKISTDHGFPPDFPSPDVYASIAEEEIKQSMGSPMGSNLKSQDITMTIPEGWLRIGNTSTHALLDWLIPLWPEISFRCLN